MLKTRTNFTRRGIVKQVVVTVVDNILMVVGIIKAEQITNRTSME